MNKTQAALIYVRGMAMGAADVVPGVSGGTIAFITGIYDTLLGALSQAPQALLLLLRGKVLAAWQQVNATFLLLLFAGILTSVFSLAKLITWLLATQPVALWSFFFGLIVISSVLVAREISRWNIATAAFFGVGVAAAYWITVAEPLSWGTDPLSLFMAGAIAICAMILPGISGSFLLLLMGLYPVVIAAVQSFDLAFLLVFAGGCVFGLLAFSRVLHWLLLHYRGVALAFLTGLMLGSLNKVWPWKEVLQWITDRHGEQRPLLESNLWPWQFAEQGHDPQLLVAILMAVAGVVLVVALELSAKQLRHRAGVSD
ncbi:DUF368 domain-containing protein [Atopomonas sediminilitoris]|uniref:DUF368 domain-containing protein n=1 Tax=Atopomonas sediminilitoris TaxID=2919919 RepID=UPI001F4DA3C6|nr:DUF368 domain-containing protein [Atopomonas sediminilitoris]MCJ8169713.1 DUF368 domain-containing protein [Atopomonas sediminilitoris]